MGPIVTHTAGDQNGAQSSPAQQWWNQGASPGGQAADPAFEALAAVPSRYIVVAAALLAQPIGPS